MSVFDLLHQISLISTLSPMGLLLSKKRAGWEPAKGNVDAVMALSQYILVGGVDCATRHNTPGIPQSPLSRSDTCVTQRSLFPCGSEDFFNFQSWERVSMGLTVSHKKTKKLTVRHKNVKI